jgi:hypothetical protein
LNGARTGSWNDVAHVNVYLFETREAKLRSYQVAVEAAMEDG